MPFQYFLFLYIKLINWLWENMKKIIDSQSPAYIKLYMSSCIHLVRGAVIPDLQRGYQLKRIYLFLRWE